MNHSRMTLAITAIVAASALTTLAFAVPQQVMAYGHKHHNNNNHNSIKVDQQINQANQCTVQLPERVMPQAAAATNATEVPAISQPRSNTICLNEGSNGVDTLAIE